MQCAIVIRPNHRIEFHRPTQGSDFTLSELQGFVGGFIEVVRVTKIGGSLIVNENGQYEHLPYNRMATAIANIDTGDSIVGDAVLLFNIPTPEEILERGHDGLASR